MTGKQLTWFEVSALEDGAKVIFAKPHTLEARGVDAQAVVPAGTAATIKENGLNEIWCAMLLTPDDEAMRTQLAAWDGNIFFGGHLDPGADGETDEAWQSLSPLALP
jgi:hypothetical protein